MSLRGSVLVVDDEERIVRSLARALAEDGHEVTATTSATEARDLLARRAFDVVLVDNRMPGVTGLELIREVVERSGAAERPQFLMMTAHASVETAVAAMKLGAFEYLQKPFEIDELLVVTRRALEHQRLHRHHEYLLAERDEEFDHYGLIGRSPAIQELVRQVELVARSRSTVLVTGETGTGKELVARAIHDRSEQRDMPLIRVNCAALPDSLLESELFGHVRGAFTGATSSKKGRFALADGGTLLLDEIGALPVTVQPKLLRVLQEREFEPLGSERTERVDVRVVAATNRDLRRLVSQGQFQEDLFYRLSVIPIEIPPLRQRREDVRLLVEHFVRRHSQRLGRRIEAVEPAALDRLESYAWPGNVRELANTVERALVLSSGPTLPASAFVLHAPDAAPLAGLPGEGLKANVEWAERESIRVALERSGGVKKDAARRLGISQRALSYYLAKYGPHS